MTEFGMEFQVDSVVVSVLEEGAPDDNQSWILWF